MNQNRKEELLTRWMDDALSAEELQELKPVLAAHPELGREREEFVKMRGELTAALPAEVDPPYPDFFNSHLMRQIEGLARGDGREARAGQRGLRRFWVWWLAPAATAALMMAFVAGMYSKPSNVPAPISESTAAYSPLDDVTAEAVQDDSLEATVIVLSGLEDIEDENLLGWMGPQAEAGVYFVTAKNTY